MSKSPNPPRIAIPRDLQPGDRIACNNGIVYSFDFYDGGGDAFCRDGGLFSAVFQPNGSRAISDALYATRIIRHASKPPRKPRPTAAERNNAVFRFLLGEGPLDGVWYGDDPPKGQHRFWWRKELRRRIARLLRRTK